MKTRRWWWSLRGGKSASDRWQKRNESFTSAQDAELDGTGEGNVRWSVARKKRSAWLPLTSGNGCPRFVALAKSSGGERRVFRGRKRKGGRTGGVTGEIWESSLGRPSFGPAMASGWMPQARARAGGCLSICVSQRGQHSAPLSRRPRQLGTSWEPLICSAPAIHDPSAPAQPTLDAGRHGPILLSRVDTPEEAGRPWRFVAGDLCSSGGSRRLQQATSFCPSAVMENGLASYRRARCHNADLTPKRRRHISPKHGSSPPQDVPSADKSNGRLLQIGRAPPPMGAYRTAPLTVPGRIRNG